MNLYKQVHWLKLSYFSQVIHCSTLPTFPTVSPSQNSVQGCSRSISIDNIWPNHLHLSLPNAHSKDWTLSPSNLRRTSELFTKSFHYILPIPRTQRLSNTKIPLTSSALNGQVTRPHGNTDLIVGPTAHPLINDRMSRQYYECFRLANDVWGFCMRKDIKSDIQLPVEI